MFYWINQKCWLPKSLNVQDLFFHLILEQDLFCIWSLNLSFAICNKNTHILVAEEVYYIKIKILASAIYFNQLKYFFKNWSETHPGASNCPTLQLILDREQKYLDKRTNFDRVDSIDCIISYNKPNNHKQSAADTNRGLMPRRWESVLAPPIFSARTRGWTVSRDTWQHVATTCKHQDYYCC